MSIPEHARKNFETLRRAFRHGDAILVETTIKATGETVYVIAAVETDQKEYIVVPFGHLCPADDPLEYYNDPVKEMDSGR